MNHKQKMTERRAEQRARTLYFPVRKWSASLGQWLFDGYSSLPLPARANLSRNHPDYGLHPKQHLANKAKRAAQA